MMAPSARDSVSAPSFSQADFNVESPRQKTTRGQDEEGTL